MAGLSLGPLVKPRDVHQDLTVGSDVDVRAVHRTRCWSFKVHAFAVIAAAVTWTFEFVFARLPVRRAAKMSAARVDHEHAIRRSIDPDTIFLLPLCIHAETVIGGIADFETGGWLEQRARQEEAEESDEPCHQEGRDGAPHKTTASLIHIAVIRSDRCHASGCRCF